MLVGLNATSLGAAGSGVIPTRTSCRGSLKPTRGNRAARLHVPRCNLGRRTFFETHDLASCRVVCGRASGFPSGHDREAGEGVSPLAGRFLPGGLERRRFRSPRILQDAGEQFAYPLHNDNSNSVSLDQFSTRRTKTCSENPKSFSAKL